MNTLESVSITGKAKGSLRRVRVGDIEISYREYGAGEPLVLIPAFATNMDMWDARFIRRLARRYRVIVLDNRGMGRTTAGTAEWSIDQFADDAAGLMDALVLGKAHVMGWSLGGDVALSLAVRYPDMVDKLVIYAGDCGGNEKVEPPRYREVFKQVRHDSPLAWVFATLFPPEWMRQHPDCWRTVPFLKMRVRPRAVSLQNKAYNDWRGVYDELPSIESEALVVSGTRDVSTPVENAFILSERIPRAKLLLAPEAGHGLMYQHPYEFASAVADFLRAPSSERVELLRYEPDARAGARVMPPNRLAPAM
ncbi:MAG TPA: alpha/beta fold hydrolase [Candidatus Anoxymicrobiaceae bacterium]